jgi:co-chaperonin GroES (HSP10)
MKLEEIRPIRDLVLIEAAVEAVSEGGIIIPLQALSRYPQSGWVVATGPECVEGLQLEDHVIMVDEGCDVDHSYYQACMLTLKDWNEVEYCDIETWAVIRETVEKFRRTGDDKKITLQTIDGSRLSMLASDVLDYSTVDLSNPTLKLEYVNASVLHLKKDGTLRLFYFVPERDILAILEIEDGSAEKAAY